MHGRTTETLFERAEPILREDPVLDRLLDAYEPYRESVSEEYERLCVSIINQQLSTASAAAVRERVFALLDGAVTPRAVLDAETTALREAGLSRSKVEYLRNAARAFQERDYTREGLAGRSDEAVVDLLTEITGVGEWTAQMYCIFVLNRPDVLPLGDLAVRRGIEQLYADGDSLTREEMREVAEPWRPFRSVATRYVWSAYEADD